MAYTVLARKYRSQRFEDVVGQDPIARTLKNAIETGRVAHAYLFTGTRGVGKTTMARILAKALNCLAADGPTTTPCCKCNSCTSINTGDDIDVIEIDGASNNRVDEIRELRENAIYRPARSRYKIYIIDEVHMLTTQAFNALLKTLEEPPEHIKFILATTEPNKVLATIQSRCQRFDFSNISPKAIAEQLKTILKKEKVGYEDDLVLPLARMANGSMRDALSLLDRLISTGEDPLGARLLEEYLGQPNAEKVHKLVEQIGSNDAAGTLTAAEDLIGSGLGETQVVDALIESMRDLLVVKSAGADTDLLMLTKDQKEKVSELAQKFDSAALIYNITALEKLRWAVKNSDTPRALLDALLLRFALSEHFMSVEELMSRRPAGSTTDVKKKLPIEGKPAVAAPPQPRQTPLSQVAARPEASCGDARPTKSSAEATFEDWPEILAMIAPKLGNATAGLLSGTTARWLKDDALAIEFPAAGKTPKAMCEGKERAERIAAALSEHFGKPIRITYEIAAEPQTGGTNGPSRPNGQKRYEILNDPGVKTLLAGLDATITGIEEA
jgi:DNA polymerase-3 subunit gamma/tau